MKSRILWGVELLLLAAFTTYVLLDTFVIEKAYTAAFSNSFDQTDDSDPGSTASSENNADNVEAHSALITENSYTDDNISITITEYREYETNIHVANVQISSPEYLKTAFAKGLFGQNITEATSEIAKGVNAIFAVNGDYYGVQEAGYVLRNGVLYRSAPFTSYEKDILAIYKDGSFSMFKEKEISAEQLLADGVEHILNFGPPLVKDGEVTIPKSSSGKHPRTAIGLMDDLHYVFLVTDGRIDDSEGLDYYQLAEFMHSLGVKEAYNLDGGGSATMYFNGNKVNHTVNNGERKISDIVYIGY